VPRRLPTKSGIRDGGCAKKHNEAGCHKVGMDPGLLKNHDLACRYREVVGSARGSLVSLRLTWFSRNLETARDEIEAEPKCGSREADQ